MSRRRQRSHISTDQRIAVCLGHRFPNNDVAPRYYGDLLIEYSKSGLSPPHLIDEIETGEEGKFWSYTWEAMLFRHLSSAGYRLKNVVKVSGQHGPDLCVEIEGRKIWIEAVVPSSEGIPAAWLEPPTDELRVRSRPDVERVLRARQ